MQGHFFLQDMVDACVDYLRNMSPKNEAKALNCYLVAEEHGYSRGQLDNACKTVENLLYRNLNKIRL